MNVNHRKLMKLGLLIMSTLLIATVSAATYYSMFMDATGVGVTTGNELFFVGGTDFGSSTMGSGNQTVTLSGLEGMNGTATIIGDPVRIKNTGAGAHSINLMLVSWTGDSEAQLNYINITLYNAVPSGGTKQGQTIYLVPGAGDVTETSSVSLGAGATWRVEWIIYWKTTATTETVDVNLKLEVS